MARVLNGLGNFTLMSGASAGLAAGTNLPGFIDKAGHEINVLVVYSQILVCAKLAEFWSGNIAAAIAVAVGFVIGHFYSFLFGSDNNGPQNLFVVT